MIEVNLSNKPSQMCSFYPVLAVLTLVRMSLLLEVTADYVLKVNFAAVERMS